jgi:hypothetical protein
MVLVKNEAYWLPYVLKQVEDIFDSYVIYDIGSTDNTRSIIDWFVARNEGYADIFVRKCPHVDPIAQGAFRNSMIVEGQRDSYFILDGDELYKPEDLRKIPGAAHDLYNSNLKNPRKRYGVFERVEVNADLTQQYDVRRGHHRLYRSDAFWTGTHPGEVAHYRQCAKSEIQYPITCWHMHNTVRSPKEGDATKRLIRKAQRSYHPGTLIDMDILEELPVLRTRIEDFPVSPALEALWAKDRTN